VRRREYPEKTPAALRERMIWHIVTKYARQTGLVDKLAPHDMRRTCAKLCRAAGGDLEQIQFLLGHASIQTTERYLGSRQNLKEAVNDGRGRTLIDRRATTSRRPASSRGREISATKPPASAVERKEKAPCYE
jgi:integrase